MNRIIVTFGALAVLLAAGNAGIAASATNRDSAPATLIVTEGGGQQELVIGAGETVDFCPAGCFVTMPNGDREALTGGETIEISDGKGRIQ